MKHSQTIGIILTLLLFFCTTQPFVIIESKNWVVTGWDAGATNFGQSGKFLFYIGILAIVFFAIPSINVKRFNMAWGALLVLSACAMGECPQKQWALYACIILSAGILIMTFLPKLKTK
jgi:ATP/ADP translocase